MPTFEFTLRLNRDITDDEIDALYEAGLDDAAIETGPLGTMATFDREAVSLAAAIVSAVRDIEKVDGLLAVGLARDDEVTIADIAERLNRNPESVRLLALGRRGPGGFPRPHRITRGGEQIWDWLAVARWVVEHLPHANITQPIHALVTADRVIAAREALLTETDEEAKSELEHLLGHR